MLKRYKNAFFEMIQAAGLNVDDFTAQEQQMAGGEPLLFEICYKPAGLTFIVGNDPEDPHAFYCSYTLYAPGFAVEPVHRPDAQYKTDSVGFKRIREWFEGWLRSHVKTAIDEELLPDLWAAASEQLASNDLVISATENFTHEERQQLKLALGTFRLRLIETFNPTEDQLHVVSEKVDYLISAVDRLNRFDWKGVALSTLIGISTTLTLDTERGRQLYGLFQQALSSLLHLIR